MQKWEYKSLETYHVVPEKSLNELGEQGWELVAVTYGDMADRYTYVFKRPKS